MNEKIEACARAAHEANRAYCISNGDTSCLRWEDAPLWQRRSIIAGVEGVLAGNDARASHEAWLAFKQAEGWRYGPIKDPEKKEHPCCVAYDELPLAQRRKDYIFVGVVNAMWMALE